MIWQAEVSLGFSLAVILCVELIKRVGEVRATILVAVILRVLVVDGVERPIPRGKPLAMSALRLSGRKWRWQVWAGVLDRFCAGSAAASRLRLFHLGV